MNSIKLLLNYKFVIFAIIGILIFSAIFSYFNYVNLVSSQTKTSKPVTGWAYSSGIGWIKLDCPTCNVLANPNTGQLSGYAWSSNIGWIKFDDVAIDLNNYVVSGWLQVCSVYANGCSGELKSNKERGGWDGKIKIINAKVDNGKITGWAWGDINVSWLNFYDVKVLNCDFNANPSVITPPQSSTLSWDCNFTSACSIDNGIGNVSSSGSIKIRPTNDTTYTLSCSGVGGNANIIITAGITNVSIKNPPQIKYKEIIPN